MTRTNTSGDKQISCKWLPPDLWQYLKDTAKRENLTETAVITQALRLHQESSEEIK